MQLVPARGSHGARELRQLCAPRLSTRSEDPPGAKPWLVLETQQLCPAQLPEAEGPG